MKKQSECCANGHPWTPENTYLWPRGDGRVKKCCRACANARSTRAYDKERNRRSVARAERVNDWKRDISPQDLAWAAGHFEGEGTISISAEKRNGYARPLASLASTDLQVIALFSDWWPTSIAGKKPRFPTENARPVYRWEINSAVKVRAFIDQMLPHLRTDRCKAKFALVSEFTDKVLAPHVGKVKERHPEYIAKIRELNHRGASPFLLPTGKTVLEQIDN